jgi:hypothetical protein
VHAPPYPAFLAPNGTWVYDKTDAPASFAEYTHIIGESPVVSGAVKVFGFMKKKEAGWVELGSVSAFERWAVDPGLLKQGKEGVGMLDRVQGVLHLEERPRLWILERTGK